MIRPAAYRREIDDRDGWTHFIEVSVPALSFGDPSASDIQLRVGDNTFAHLDLEHARQIREALDEAIMLLEVVHEQADDLARTIKVLQLDDLLPEAWR